MQRLMQPTQRVEDRWHVVLDLPVRVQAARRGGAQAAHQGDHPKRGALWLSTGSRPASRRLPGQRQADLPPLSTARAIAAARVYSDELSHVFHMKSAMLTDPCRPGCRAEVDLPLSGRRATQDRTMSFTVESLKTRCAGHECEFRPAH